MTWLVLFLDLIFITYCVLFIRMMVLIPSRAPFVPTRTEVVHEIASIIGPLPEGSIFYDIGCGDGVGVGVA